MYFYVFFVTLPPLRVLPTILCLWSGEGQDSNPGQLHNSRLSYHEPFRLLLVAETILKKLQATHLEFVPVA
jgi:hypothetical protein